MLDAGIDVLVVQLLRHGQHTGGGFGDGRVLGAGLGSGGNGRTRGGASRGRPPSSAIIIPSRTSSARRARCSP
jgi:hypothetical protein